MWAAGAHFVPVVRLSDLGEQGEMWRSPERVRERGTLMRDTTSYRSTDALQAIKKRGTGVGAGRLLADDGGDEYADDEHHSDYRRAEEEESAGNVPPAAVAAVSPAIDIVPTRFGQCVTDDPDSRQRGERDHCP